MDITPSVAGRDSLASAPMDISTTPGARPSLASAAMEISPRRSLGVMTPIREDEERATPSAPIPQPSAED